MTRVICTFHQCKHLTDIDDEGYGICGKEEITLDERVDNIFVGCPDAEWNTEEEE